MDDQIRKLGAALLLCFAALFIRLNWVQIYSAQELAEDPINTRTIVEDFGQQRGDIVTADGVVVATSIETGGQLGRERNYPQGELYGHITGYYAFNYGASGLERSYNAELSGHENPVPVTEILDLLGDEDRRADAHLNIRDDLQRAAQAGLGGRRGSVVALDPRSGAVLAMWTAPSYDPNRISTNDLDAAEQAWADLNADPQNPALARTYREVFAPGSTFKVITAAAGLTSGRVNEISPVFDQVDGYTAPLTTSVLTNFAGSTCGGSLSEILRDSCNTAFAEMGAERLGPELMIQGAEAAGFNDSPPIDLPDAAVSVFPSDFGAELSRSELDDRVAIVENTPALAQASIGQFDVRATPLQMALIAGAVANNGTMLAPQVVDEVIAGTGAVVLRNNPDTWRQAFAPDVANTLRQLMLSVVTSGTAQSLQVPGLEIGAKTGTAQTLTEAPTDDTHAWVIAFAGRPGAPPEFAIAVIVEAVPGGGQQTGGSVAAPIARSLIEVAFSGQ